MTWPDAVEAVDEGVGLGVGFSDGVGVAEGLADAFLDGEGDGEGLLVDDASGFESWVVASAAVMGRARGGS